MLYWRSNTGTTASIDYTNGALDGACYIGGATLEQQHLLIIPTEHWTEHVILAATLEQQLLIGALEHVILATLEQQHLLIIPTEHWTEHVILTEQHWNNSIY